MAPSKKAATRGVKRAAGDVTSRAKQPRVDPAEEAVKRVVENTEELPESCKAMLIAMLPSAFGTPKDERNTSQTRVIEMIAEVLEAQKSSMQAAIDAEQAKVDDLECSKSQLEEKVSHADATLKETNDVLANKRLAAEETGKSSKEACAALKKAQIAQATGETQAAKIEAERHDLQEVLEKFLPNLCGEGFQADAAVGHRDSIMDVLKRSTQVFEATLLMTLPEALIKPPGERGDFDTMAIETFQKDLGNYVQKLDGDLRTAESAKSELAAAVEGAAANITSAQEAEITAQNEVASAEESQKVATDALEAAKAERQNFEPFFAIAVAARDATQATLRDFEEHTIKSFTSLESKHSAALAEEVGKMGA